MKILVFGGSFNPFHLGHLKMINIAREELQIKNLWLLPSFKNKILQQQTISDKERLIILKKSVAHLTNVKIITWEMKQQKITFTFETITRLQKLYPSYQFYFLIGGDQVNELPKWGKIKQLTKIVQFVALKRKGIKLNYDNIKKYRIILLTQTGNKISSSLVRKGYFNFLTPQALSYVLRKKSFFKLVLQNHLSWKRFIHSLNVASMAYDLALLHAPYLKEKAYVAGLFHDICKEKTPQQLKQMVLDKFYHLEKENVATWHQWAGSFFIQKYCQIKDHQILQAISKHTTASLRMNLLDKILYCADKIALERNYPEVEKLREICYQDLEVGFVKTYATNYQFLLKKKTRISDQTKKIAHRILNNGQ